MTDPVTLSVAGAAVAVAVWAGWASLPTPPVLDGERWFKVTLATLLRGVVEAEGGDQAAWERSVLRFVPYHPAGRRPETKIDAPERVVLSGVPGEPALLLELTRLPDARARAHHLYVTSDPGRVARLSDPAELGADYDLARWLGAGASWDDVADLGAGDGRKALEAANRAVPARWVVLGATTPAPDLLAALERVGAARIPADDADGVATACSALLTQLDHRLVIVAAGGAATVAMDALARHAGLRDRVLGVVAIGADLGDPAFVAGFTDARFEVESRRRLPCFSLQWFDLATGDTAWGGVPLGRARFPEPGRGSAEPVVLDSVDLGPLPPTAELPVDRVAEALVLVVSGWIRAHAP